MKLVKKFIIAALIVAPALASAQTSDQQAAGDSGLGSVGGASGSMQTPSRYSTPDDSVVGLGPIYKNP